METITITFGEVAQNHSGMQRIGNTFDKGLTFEDLTEAKRKFENNNRECELIHLHKLLPNHVVVKHDVEAYVLVIRNGVKSFVQPWQLFKEQKKLEFDKMVFMRGRVMNKRARWNLCFSDLSQEPDYANRKGRVVCFEDVPHLALVREMLPNYFGEKTRMLLAESNYYYNTLKCGVAYHGDSERKVIVAVRLGAPFPLRFKWFQNNDVLGEDATLYLNNGDMYAMSEWATGFNWKKRQDVTVRHAAGLKFI